jgi:hypothetical protein
MENNIYTLDNLSKLFKDKPDNTSILLGYDWKGNIYLHIQNTQGNTKETNHLLLNPQEKEFKIYNPNSIDGYPHLIEYKNLKTLLDDFSQLIDNNILVTKSDISNSNKEIETFKQYKNIVLNGNYNANLSKKYSVELPDTSIKRDFFKINSTRIAVFFDTINNTYQYSDDYAFNLSQFDEEYIKHIDRLFLEKNNLIKSNTKLNIEYNSILDALRSIYSEFFI